mgnify:CR=1 FL=1
MTTMANMRLDSTYEGLKQNTGQVAQMARTSLDSTYEGLKLLLSRPANCSFPMFGQYL